MEKIIYKKNVLDYLDELVYLLFEKEYFSYYENSEKYLEELVEFVSKNIKDFPNRKSTIQLNHLGSQYIFYKSNKRTTWYIFFEQSNNNYLITGILNNHCEEAKFI